MKALLQLCWFLLTGSTFHWILYIILKLIVFMSHQLLQLMGSSSKWNVKLIIRSGLVQELQSTLGKLLLHFCCL